MHLLPVKRQIPKYPCFTLYVLRINLISHFNTLYKEKMIIQKACPHFGFMVYFYYVTLSSFDANDLLNNIGITKIILSSITVLLH